MKNNDLKILGLFLIGVALLLGLVYINDSSRSALVFDQETTQDFQLEMIRFDDEVVKGGLLDARLEIQNLGETGSMFVECGVFDRNKVSGSWVPRSAQITMLDAENNCQTSDAFVNTAQVFLKKNERVAVNFKMQVPVDYTDDVVLFCSAFERCWSETQINTYQSSKLSREITVLPAAVLNETKNDEVLLPDNDEVIIIDEENISGSNTTFKSWMRNNSLLFVGIIFVLMFIGAGFVYAEPKNKIESMWD